MTQKRLGLYLGLAAHAFIYVAIATFVVMTIALLECRAQDNVDKLVDAIEKYTDDEASKTGQDRQQGQLRVVSGFKTVTGPAVLYMDWNDPTIVVNHPLSDKPIEAPALADEFFEALKVGLTIKANSKDTQDLLMLILSKVRLNNINLEVQDNEQ